MMMPQQIQMPPMPPGLSMHNFMPRMSSISSTVCLQSFVLAPMPGLPFMGPPIGFPRMAFNGPRF